MKVLQQWRRLDLAERRRALENSSTQVYGGERRLERDLGSPSQPFICEAWVLGLLSKLTTYKDGR
jgi:hypothetical protein